jgi:2-polyprenyl-6-methoxyphenol hydroxylase-like FAD-dependent oxidoreductase
MSTINPSQKAIVIGGSVTGLLVARVLSDYFNQVVLIEQDKLSDQPESRKGQPQANHLHALLATGKEILAHYFPDLIEALEEGGAILADMSQAARWHISGGYRLQYESGMTAILMSRPFLEYEIRRRVRKLPNITVLDESIVEDLIATPQGGSKTVLSPNSKQQASQVVGVRVKRIAEAGSSLTLNANLVVDASGRGSASLRWLTALGMQPGSIVVNPVI